jgi:hypothetical protein
MASEKDARGNAFRSTSGANPAILAGSCSIFTPSKIRDETSKKNSYNDDKVKIAIPSIDTILCTSEYSNAKLLAEMVPN